MENPADSPEYRILRYLNDRSESYDITFDCLKNQLFDIDNAEFQRVYNALYKQHSYIGIKDKPKFGMTITTSGAKRLGRIENAINEYKALHASKPEQKRIIDKVLPYATLTGIITTAIFAFLNYGKNTEIDDLKIENKALRDSISVCREYIHQHNKQDSFMQ